MTEAAAPIRDTTDMPLRLRAAAQVVADADRASYGLGQADLDTVSAISFERYVTLARAVLDAVDAADPRFDAPLGSMNASIARIFLAKTSARSLCSQGVVLFDVQQDGEVRIASWTQASGTAAEALAAWARSVRNSLGPVPFRTVFGMGRGGVPTPLTPAERASLTEAGRAYADRTSPESRP